MFILLPGGSKGYRRQIRRIQWVFEQVTNKQSFATALKKMTAQGILEKVIIKEKPLHIAYNLSEKGQSLVAVFYELEKLSDTTLNSPDNSL